MKTVEKHNKNAIVKIRDSNYMKIVWLFLFV